MRKPTKCRRIKCPSGFKELLEPSEFIRSVPLPLFEKQWAANGLDDLDLNALEILFMLNPTGSPVIRGTGGIRKLRFSSTRWARGKSGGARIYYLYLPNNNLVFWLFMHMKNRADSINEKLKAQLRKLVTEIKNHLREEDDEAS